VNLVLTPNGQAVRLTKRALAAYFRERGGPSVAIRSFGTLGGHQSADVLKGFGYGAPILIEVLEGGHKRRMVLETMRPGPNGHEHMADRAHAMLWDYASYNHLPRHVRAEDVGAFTKEGRIRSIADAKEVFLLTEFVEGREYQYDLGRIARTGKLERLDLARTRALADYLILIHRRKKRDAGLYRRALRDLIGHGECILGVVDTYPTFYPAHPRRVSHRLLYPPTPSLPRQAPLPEPQPAKAGRLSRRSSDGFITPKLLESIEQRCNLWRWRLRDKTRRLSQVHGDFHPWNVLFRKATDFSVLDRARQEWGEPADDVTCMTMNYLFSSVNRWGNLRGPFERLFRMFWDRYLERTGDQGVLEAAPPFFAFRGLVVASPVWYPDISMTTRRNLFNFVEAVLDQSAFDPARVNDYLKS
jgi:phosphotransferase family enzyme